MAELGNPSSTLAVMKKHDFSVRKKYGQNFLIDDNILRKIISASGVTKDDFVVEIGPGIGTMTQYLCEAAREVAAVEIDDKLIPVLEDTLSAYDNVSVIHNDILKVDIAELAREKNDGRPIKVVANLPYYITTPIIMGLLESRTPIDSITIMIQKEVADRMKSDPGKKTYGSLSLAVQYFSDIEIVAEVPPRCFLPAPSVGSTVVHLAVREKPAVETKDEELLFKLIRAAFNQRRKTLSNSLKNAPNLAYTREQILEAIEKLGEKPTVRGEELSLEKFARLADILKEGKF